MRGRLLAVRCLAEAGISLLEVVVATSLFGVVVALFGPTMTSAFHAGRVIDNESRAIDEIEVAVARLDRELRSARCIAEPAAGGSGPRLSFTTMADRAGAYDVTYSVTGGRLLRTTASGTSEVGEGLVVTSQEFTHVANPGQRGTVTITLRVRFEDSHGPRAITTTIAGRNAWASCP